MKKSILKRLWVVGLFLVLILPTPAFAWNLSGYSDIGLGIESPLGSGSTAAGSGEAGNFIYMTFTSDIALQLVQATYNFTGKDVEWDGDIHFVPTVKSPGLTFATFPAILTPPVQVFGFTATGFDSTDFLNYGLNLDKVSFPHSGTPLGADYIGGTLTVLFNDGTTAGGTFAALDPNIPLSIFNARATFSASGTNGGENGGGPITTPEPTTMLLLGLGLAGLAGVTRKFKK